ncbi:hypothetical protein R6Q59_034611, partial [Mikania micrantha]
YSYYEIDPPLNQLDTGKHPSSLLSGRKAVDMSGVEEQRNAILGEPLSKEEVSELVEQYRHSDCSRQINL